MEVSMSKMEWGEEGDELVEVGKKINSGGR
jgi:hypothetical protein